jgi:long-subunit acyl-CoA synthetase (AMP-forming)
VSLVLTALEHHAAAQPRHKAIDDNGFMLDYARLRGEVLAAAAQLRSSTGGTVALAMENGAAWVVSDLALLAAGLPCLPMPSFFTAAQQCHALRDSGATWLLSDRPAIHAAMLQQQGIFAKRAGNLALGQRSIAQFRLSTIPAALPAGTAKITYTSGTTGAPKGVCLSTAAIETVAAALAAAVQMTPGDCHACLLPLATLLENIGGVYAPLLAGANLRPAAIRQLYAAGDFGLNMAAALSAATTTILVPQMLHALLASISAGVKRPDTLRFAAVGGARVAPDLLRRAASAGLPVFEGYGLSECASVVALNTPRACRPGSAGKPLPHIRIGIASDGEILVSGGGFLGYAGQAHEPGQAWPTGDLGRLDEDGFLHLTGRKKDVFITAFGRNVSPEWVESELDLQPAISRSWVHGEARPWNAAVLVARPGATRRDVDAALAAANDRLPAYAQVRQWLPAAEAFSPANGELTANGRLRRAVIAARYLPLIDRLYLEHALEIS